MYSVGRGVLSGIPVRETDQSYYLVVSAFTYRGVEKLPESAFIRG